MSCWKPCQITALMKNNCTKITALSIGKEAVKEQNISFHGKIVICWWISFLHVKSVQGFCSRTLFKVYLRNEKEAEMWAVPPVSTRAAMERHSDRAWAANNRKTRSLSTSMAVGNANIAVMGREGCFCFASFKKFRKASPCFKLVLHKIWQQPDPDRAGQ